MPGNTTDNLIDFMIEGALGSLAGEELDAYLSAYDQLAARQYQLLDNKEALRKSAPRMDERFSSTVATKRLEAQFELAGSALIGGLTNVATLTCAATEINAQPYLGIGVDISNHAFGHMGGNKPGAKGIPYYEKTRGWLFGLIARLAQRLEENGVAGAELLVPLTFMVIIGTVALQSVTARPLARLLKVAEPGPRGFLIIGANPVARAIGQTLSQNNFPVILTDSSWESIRTARMEGLPTFYGNPVSSHADQYLDLVGYGKLLGLSPRRELNTMATMRYRLEFGEPNVYSLPWQSEKEEKHDVAAHHRGATLFGPDMTYARLASLLSQGADIRKTRITEEFDFKAYLAVENRQVWPLFAVDSKDRIHVFTSESQPEPRAGWSVIGLIKEEQSAEENGDQAS